MRKLLVALAVLLLVGIAVLVAAALSLNRIIASNRQRILDGATAAVGRAVTIDHITVSFRGGLGVRLEGVGVADDPRFSSSEFVRAAAVTVHAKLLPLLRSRLEVLRIDVQQPKVQLIRDAAGQWNYATVGQRSGTAQSELPPALAGVAPAVASFGAVAAEPPPYLIRRISIEDGSVVVTEHTEDPPKITHLTHIDLALRDVGTQTPIQFTLDLALEKAREVHLTGTVGPLENQAAVPIAFDGSLGPFGQSGLRVDQLQVQAVVGRDAVRISQLEGHAFDGSFAVTGQVPLRPGAPLAINGKLANISIARVLLSIAKDAAQQFSGTAQLTADVTASGDSSDALQASIAGKVAAQIDRGFIREFNLPDHLLARFTSLPGIGTLLSTKVKSKYVRLFAENATRFDTLRGTFTIGDQRIRTDDFAIIATDYGLRLNGWVKFDREADLSGTLLLSKALSSDVAADVKEAKYLLDDNGQLALPFVVRGKFGEAQPQPDSERLAELLSRALGQGAATDLLNAFLGGKHREEHAANPSGELVDQALRSLRGH